MDEWVWSAEVCRKGTRIGVCALEVYRFYGLDAGKQLNGWTRRQMSGVKSYTDCTVESGGMAHTQLAYSVFNSISKLLNAKYPISSSSP